MQIISFSCPNCQLEMQVPADKAGKSGKCPRCMERIVVPAADSAVAGITAGPSHPIAVAPPAEEEEEIYRFREEEESSKPTATPIAPEQSEPELAQPKPVAPERKRERIREIAALRTKRVDPAGWQAVYRGLAIALMGVACYAAALGLQRLVYLTGILAPEQYANLAIEYLEIRGNVPMIGEPPPVRTAFVGIGLLGAKGLATLWIWVYRVSYVLILAELVLFILAGLRCFKAPKDTAVATLGAGLLIVSIATIVTVVIFRLIPVTLAPGLGTLQIVAPEVAFSAANAGRLEPIHVALSANPFTDAIAAMVVRIVDYIPMIFLCVLLRFTAVGLKETELESKAISMVRLGLGIAFIDLTMLLLSNVGTSDVLIMVMRFIYLLFNLFLVLWIVGTAMTVGRFRDKLRKTIRFLIATSPAAAEGVEEKAGSSA